MEKLLKNKVLISILAALFILFLCCIAIVSVLTYGGAKGIDKTNTSLRDTQRRATLNDINLALAIYYNDYGTYPTSQQIDVYKNKIIIGDSEIELKNHLVVGDKTTEDSTQYCIETKADSYELAVTEEESEKPFEYQFGQNKDCDKTLIVNSN